MTWTPVKRTSPLERSVVSAKPCNPLVPITSIIDLIAGSYVILDDNATRLIPSGVEQFRVTASRSSGATVEALYEFSAPQGCHIEKVSGPDTLVVS